MEGKRRKEREREGVETKLNRIIEGVLGKKDRVVKIRERRREQKGIVLIVEFGEEGDARGIIESKGEIRWC